MRGFVRALLVLLVLAVLGAGAAYYYASQQPGPVLDLRSPEKYVGQSTALEFFVETPEGALPQVTATLEQNGQATPVFTLGAGETGEGEVKQVAADRMWVIRQIGKASVPSLQAGPARLTLTATRPVFFGLREATTTVTRDLEVRLDPPRVAVVSLHHFVNHGGAEFVVMRATPEDVTAGVKVGETEYPAFPGSSVGLTDPALRVAFFALAHDQDTDTPMTVFARDPAGNEAIGALDHRVFPKPFAKSTIPLDDRFLARVVPAIAASTPSLAVETGTPEQRLEAYLKINGELRRQNNQTIADFAQKTRPEMLWTEAFSQLGNTAVQSRFADYRTYTYDGRDVDQQVHLGFDLASTAQAPVAAANRGVVLYAQDLGIYGNTVIVDHGLGVQSLYAHLSSFEVKEGDTVDKGQSVGRTGITGLAGGDHLHFTISVSGTQVNPVEWWDPHWMEDRVFRKIREAGGTPPSSPTP